VAVAGGNEQVSILARQSAQGRGVGIEQRPQDCRKGGLGRSLLARQHDHRIGAAIAQDGQCPGDYQHEIGVRLHVEKGTQCLDRSALYRDRQRLHAGGAAESHRRIVDHPPASGVDLHCSPSIVAEVEIEAVIEPAHTNINNAFWSIEMRLGLDHIQRRLQGFGTWRATRGFEEVAREPPAKALGADRPGLTVAVDVEVGEAGPIRGVE
jgi:hypothetical protein